MEFLADKVDRDKWVVASMSGMRRYFQIAKTYDKSVGEAEISRIVPIITRFADEKELSESENKEVLVLIMFSEGEKHSLIRDKALELLTS